ncbi:MAG: DUF885 domain-containing protein [Verrucomicrobiales bacterium]|nr:DUF885 domain-containing protein [Verrucomicrobiales bacterium]
MLRNRSALRRRVLLGLGWLLLLVSGVARSAPAGEGGADADLAAFFRSYLDRRFELEPTVASLLGEHRFDDRLENPTAEAQEQWEALVRRTLRELPRVVDRSRLGTDGRIDFDIFRHELETSVWLSENTRPFEEDPRAYNAYISDSVYVLLAQSTLPKEVNLSNAVARMRRIPAVTATAKARLRRPPKPILETAIRQNRGAIGFYGKELLELAGETPQAEVLRGEAAKVVKALEDYQVFLEGELMARADGPWRLGKRRFARKLDLVLDAGMSAEEVLADARSEFRRVRDEMYVISRQLWSRYFPKETLPPGDEEGRRATTARVIAAVGEEHGKPEELVEDARATVERIRGFIHERDILRLPDPDRCRVIEMPEFKRGNSLAYLESAPPLEPATASFYAVSPPPSYWGADRVKSFLEEYNRHMLQVLTIHEAYPGHYVQLEYSNRSPSLIRRVLQSGVFIEGWAVYTEQMMLDQGYGDGDPRLRLNQLKFYLRAVANAILDHEMHAGDMTDEQALAFLMNGAFQSEGEARLKIVRAKQTSTQLSTYFVGRMALQRLRDLVQREWGDRFDLGRYHEAVIGHGSVPPRYLAELVRERLQAPR